MTDRRTAPEMAETPMGHSWARLQALLPFLPAPVPPPSLDGCPCDPVSGQCIMSEPEPIDWQTMTRLGPPFDIVAPLISPELYPSAHADTPVLKKPAPTQ